MGKRSKRTVLKLLVLLVILVLISGTKAADDDVVAEADEMTRKIEEESKKVDDQNNAMVSEIEAKSKTVEDVNQEKRFEEASKHVDDVMDEREKAVDDKANFAEELENEAERKVEDLGKKIEGSHPGYNGISRKRSTSVITDLGTKMSTSGLRKRTTITYQMDLPPETSVGEQIEEVMQEGEQRKKISEDLMKTDKNGNQQMVPEKDKADTPENFSGLQELNNDLNNETGEFEDGANPEETVDSSSQQDNQETEEYSKQNEAIESFSDLKKFSSKEDNESGKKVEAKEEEQSDSLVPDSQSVSDTHDDEYEEMDTTKHDESKESFADLQLGDDANDGIIGNEIRQREPKYSFSESQEDENEATEVLTSQNESTETLTENLSESKHRESNKVADDPMDNERSNTKHKSDTDTAMALHKPLTTGKDKNGKADDDNEQDGAIFDVDVYKENSSLPLQNNTRSKGGNGTEIDQEDESSSTMEGSSTIVASTPRQYKHENDTKTEQQKPHEKQSNTPADIEINFTPDVKLSKPDQKFLNEIEEDYALRMSQRKKKNHDKELQDVGVTKLEDESDARWQKMNPASDPEMLLRWPFLGKVVGNIGANQKVSSISPGEVDFLQTEYPDYMKHDANNHKVELVLRNAVAYKRKDVAKGRRKQNHLRKLLVKH